MTDFERACEIALVRSKVLILHAHAILHKPIIGAAFADDRYVIGTIPVESHGLHGVKYFVIQGEGLPIGSGDSFAEALRDARGFLAAWGAKERAKILHAVRRECEEFVRGINEERAADLRARTAEAAPGRTREDQPVPKRRREVFDKSGGKCHYCGTVLDLTGKWHIEHKMPRALFGGSEQSNLVASCVNCNMRKKDKTDLEFIAEQGVAST